MKKISIIILTICLLLFTGCNSKKPTIRDCILSEINNWIKSDDCNVNIDKQKEIKILSLTLNVIENKITENFMLIESSVCFFNDEDTIYYGDLMLFVCYKPSKTFSNRLGDMFERKDLLQIDVDNCDVDLYCKNMIVFE